MKSHILLFFFIVLFPPKGMAQDQPVIDSLLQVLAEVKEDTIKIDALIELGNHYSYVLPDSALYYLTEALEISNKINSSEFKAVCYRNLGMVIEHQGFYDKALEKYFKALEFFEEIGNKVGIAECYNDIAIIHYMQGSYELCGEYLTKSYEIKEEMGDRKGVSTYFSNMAVLKEEQGQYESAIEFVNKSIELFEELNDSNGIGTAYANLGTIYNSMGDLETSLDYHLKSIDLYEELNSKEGLAHSTSNVAAVYVTMADSIATSGIQRSEYLNKAIIYGRRSLEIAQEIDALFIENYVASTLKMVYIKLGNYRKALDYAELYISTRDSLFNQEKTSAIQEMETKYETEKKQQQIELQESQLLVKDATIRQQKTLRNALGAGLAAVVLIIIIIIYAYIQKQKDNRKILEQNEQIIEANEELVVLNEAISKQNNEIVDSINYAQRIQSAMLPPESYVTELLNENFILYKPRDIVSGDFYWIKQVNQYIVLVAADCTGHGVPGALMSMLGISYLNEIVQRREITQANQVLNELRKQIKYSLRQHGQRDESKDGIDMALCVLDLKNNRMQYSGAFNPLYLIRDAQGKPELIEIKADRMPLGYYQGKDITFVNHDVQLEMGDSFYLFSDGYIDQKGGKNNKKFMSKNFKNLLLEVHDQPMPYQKEILEKTLTDWMGTNSQMDDILVVGVRV
jgi:serine phosphatase RsbU (regulator of sigma subunit)